MTQHDDGPRPKRDISENFPISPETHAEGHALVQKILDKKAATDAQS